MNGTMEDVRPAPVGRVRRWSFAAGAGAVVSAFVVSACCIGPLVLGLLGIAGTGLLVKFEPYRPYFTVATLAPFAAAFSLTYRKPRTMAAEGNACRCEMLKANRSGKIMPRVATVLVAALWAFSYLLPVLFR